MKIRAIRGRNQRGIAFLSDSLKLGSEYAKLSCGGTHVIVSLKQSSRVPEGAIILDKKYFDALSADEDSLIDVDYIDDYIPISTEITLQIYSDRLLAADKIVEVFSKKIEDLEPYLDGMVVEEGVGYPIEELGVSFIVSRMTPKSDSLKAGRISWPQILKIYLEAKTKSKEFNLCFITEIGAVMMKNDISDGTNLLPRHAISLNLTTDLLNTLLDGIALFTSILFSEETDSYPASGPSEMAPESVMELSKWFDEKVQTHSRKHSNPAIAIEEGFAVALHMTKTNNLPTFVILVSSGTYSQGVNPIPVVRSLLSSVENIFVGCIGVGSSIDGALLNEIATIGEGIYFLIDNTLQQGNAKKRISSWIKKDG